MVTRFVVESWLPLSPGGSPTYILITDEPFAPPRAPHCRVKSISSILIFSPLLLVQFAHSPMYKVPRTLRGVLFLPFLCACRVVFVFPFFRLRLRLLRAPAIDLRYQVCGSRFSCGFVI